jgi:TonB family protein
LYKEWYDNSQLKSVYHYSFDVAVDTCLSWYENGSLSMQMDCDENGNGFRTDYYKNGSIKGEGKVRNGQPHQRWKYFRENGHPLMDVSFYESDVLNATCYNEDGNEFTGECNYSSMPMFPGGNMAWMQFIKDHLVYPDEAKQKGIAGMVRVFFDIDTEGKLSNFDIVYSPDAILSAEVIRLLQSSPAWIPAKKLNEPIAYRNKQEIFFKEFE